MSKDTVLLHICCAPCATSVVETLKNDNYEVIGYFYNPNIHPETEYNLRLKELEKLADNMALQTIIGVYTPQIWLEQIKGLEDAQEGGDRCKVCYKLRLEHTAKIALEKGYQYFTTTLSVSPHKPADIINSIGQEVGERYGIKFLSYDFKKKDGFKISLRLTKKYNLYRQSYCGCIYSMQKDKHNNM